MEIRLPDLANSRLQVYVDESQAELVKIGHIEKSTIEHFKDMMDKCGLTDMSLLRSHYESHLRDTIQDIFADLKAKHEADMEEKQQHMTEQS